MSVSSKNLNSMFFSAIRYSTITALGIVIASFIWSAPGRIVAALFSTFVVLIYFLTSLVFVKFSKLQAFTFLALVQLGYILKLLLVALMVIGVLNILGERIDRDWFGYSVLIVTIAWLIGEVRGFLKIKYILSDEDIS